MKGLLDFQKTHQKNMKKKVKSLGDAIKEKKKQYQTKNQLAKNFYVGQKIKIITPFQDFHFFNLELATVISIEGKYLPIRVKFDEPRHYIDWIMTEFDFEPEDLCDLEKALKIEKENTRQYSKQQSIEEYLQ